MKITKIEAIPFRVERDRAQATGTAGSPAKLQGGGSRYRWAEHYPVLYSTCFETALVRVELDSGLVGWGEAQAPLAPEVVCEIVNRILAAAMEQEDFEGTASEIERLWWRMYSAMRVRGQTGGFMLDAIAGVDLAMWDLAGKLAGAPVSALLGAKRDRVPAYLSGLPGGTPEGAREWVEKGFAQVKLFHDAGEERLFANFDAVQKMAPGKGNVAVDALWRLTPESAPAFARELEGRSAMWLEAPLAPESAAAHGVLARATRTPLAIGESYRTVFELEPFFEAGAMKFVQPDLGRTGLTEGLRIARAAEVRGISVVPHVSIALGPQIAAAIHFAAAVPNCSMLEFNPNVVEMANRYLREPLRMDGARYVVPKGDGLGIGIVRAG
jgi:D-galactarolactone cycloisomerase